MGKTFDRITPEFCQFIEAQHVFFVATAPLSGGGHVNVSPKGLDCLRVLSETRLAYLDLTGSGNETSAHVEENGRITIMFCAFDGAPTILRLYGRGRTVLPDAADWHGLAALFPRYPGTRQIIVADVHRAMTSCGFAVPLYDFRGQRDTLPRWCEKKGPDVLARYRREKNVRSIDGLPTALGQAPGTD